MNDLKKWMEAYDSALAVKPLLESLPKGKVVVYTYGVWDLLHPGHLRLLARARDLGDFLVVGVVTDEPVRQLKGEGRPVQTLQDRLYGVACLRFVDAAIPQKLYDPSEEIRTLGRVDILTKGDDWEKIPGAETIRKMGGKLVKLSYSKEYSSSELISKISGKPKKLAGEPKC